jgi:hypothetical protein
MTTVDDSSAKGMSVPRTTGWRVRSAAEVVTVEGDVELADRRPHALVLADRVCQTLSQGHAPALDADECQPIGPAVLLDDFVADADERPAHIVGGHDLAAGHVASIAIRR